MDALDDELERRIPASVHENISTIAEYYERNQEHTSRAQRWAERASLVLGSPGYVVANLVFIVLWILWNTAGAEFLGVQQLDEPPFFWLQGLIGLNAFIISTTVLIRQNRMSKLANNHAHLDLQVSLLAEEKTSKIIEMLEDLRRDMPDVSNKVDRDAEELANPTDTKAVLSVIEQEADGFNCEKK